MDGHRPRVFDIVKRNTASDRSQSRTEFIPFGTRSERNEFRSTDARMLQPKTPKGS